MLTNDGELTNMLIHPRYHLGKTYILKIKGQVMPNHIQKFEEGVELEDGMTQPAKITILQRRKDATIVELTIYEGKKRQIRRMCDALNLALVDLERIRFGNLTLEGLRIGEYREITGRELEKLRQLLQE
jgi:pseudouridine synthase